MVSFGRVGLAAAVLFLSAAHCVADEKPVTIGAVYNLTGGQALLDVPSAQGARLAVEVANATGGVLGRVVDLKILDGETDPSAISVGTARLLAENPRAVGLIGLSDTNMVLAAAPLAARQKRVFLTSGATSPQLQAEVPDYLFLACFGDNVQAAAGAEWAYDSLGARTVVVLYHAEHDYTRLLHGYFETRFEQLGGTVAAVRPFEGATFDMVISDLPDADLIYLAALPSDVESAVPSLRGAGIRSPILGGDGLDVGEDWAHVDGATNVYFTTHAYLGADNPDPQVQAFRKAFAKAHPDKAPDAFTALGYDAAGLLMAAVDAAGTDAPEAVLAALAAMRDYHGVTGAISYPDGSRIPVKSVTIMRVEDGHTSFVEAVLPKRVPAP